MLWITGSTGQLGSELIKLLPYAFATNSSDIDISDTEAVENFVTKNNIDIIINCAAYTAVDKAEDELEIAEKINIQGPRNLAKTGAKIIHISTDYVFDGQNYKPYIETDETNPCSVYGRTKFAGEQEILKNAETAIIIRTSWLYSTNRNNFVKSIINLCSNKDSLGVVCDQVGTPTYATDLVKVIAIILPYIKSNQKEIYHFSNEGVCSWYDFAVEIANLAGLKCKIYPIESKDYVTKAKRPFYSVLNKSKIKHDFGIKIPHWKESLKICLNQF